MKIAKGKCVSWPGYLHEVVLRAVVGLRINGL